jgi:ribosomal protection tetracycline resistance protein
VQKEVIQATLADDFGLEVGFRETTTICVERPAATGEAVEILQDDANPFSATVGLRVDPAATGSGVEFRLDLDHRALPIYIYKTAESFSEAMTQYVRATLREGLLGWRVTDCIVTMTACDYYIGDGAGKPSGGTTRTIAADFRKLTPMVLMQALERAGTVVCEPVLKARLEVPASAIGSVLAVLGRLDGVAQAPSLEGELATIEAALPAARAQDLQRQLPALTAGEGVMESDFGGYEPVSGMPPARRRLTANPLNRAEYLLHLAGRTT